MKRIMAVSLVVLIALAAVVVQRQATDDNVVLVGYGKGSGWSGTDYITDTSAAAREIETVKQTVRDLYDAINEYNEDRLSDISVDIDGEWRSILREAKSTNLAYHVDIIDTIAFDGTTCEMEVTTRITSPTAIIKKPITTRLIQLVRTNSGWTIV